MATELKALFDKYGTDKGRSGYHEVYERLFSESRKTILAVLEIGVGTLHPRAHSSMVGYGASHYRPGASLRVWAEYFPNAHITGLDTQNDCLINEPRIVTHLANSTRRQEVDDALAENMFDLIVDDGDHEPSSQIATLQNCWRRVKPGGYYVIEDTWRKPNILAMQHA